MNTGNGENMTEEEAQAEAMKAKLQGDAASWSAARGGEHARHQADFGTAIAKPVRAPAAPRKAKPAAPPPPLVPLVKKPFSMSYDGVSAAEHGRQMNAISRGTK